MRTIRTVLFSICFYGGSLTLVPLALIAAYIGHDTVIWASRFWARWHRFCARWCLGITSKIEGELPQNAVLVAIKHESFFEAIQLLAIFDRPAVVMKKQLTDLPIWGKAARAHGAIPVDRDAGSIALRQMLKAGKQAIAQGRPIIIFPEGTRTPHGQSPALKSGLAGLYKLLKLPIVPIAIDSGKLWPHSPGVVTWKVGESIPQGLPREEVESRVHTAINALNS